MMLFYLLNMEECHYNLLHEDIYLWEYLGCELEDDFDCRVFVLSRSMYAS